MTDGKTEEECKKIMEENHVEYITRQKVVIEIGHEIDLVDIITDFITDNNI